MRKSLNTNIAEDKLIFVEYLLARFRAIVEDKLIDKPLVASSGDVIVANYSLNVSIEVDKLLNLITRKELN